MINIDCYAKLSLEDNFLTRLRHVLQLNKRLLMMVLSVGCVCGYESLDAAEYDDYVRLKDVDTQNSNSWRSKGNWSNKSAPSPENNYYVPEGSLLWRKHSDDVTTRIWNGGQLAIAGIFHCQGNKGDGFAPYIADLVLCPGAFVRVPSYGPFSKSDDGKMGLVTVEGTTDSPSIISHQNTNPNEESRSNTLNVKFNGNAENVLVYERPDVDYTGATCYNGWKCRAGEDVFKDYFGTFIFRGKTAVLQPLAGTAFNWPNTALRVELGAKCLMFRDETVNNSTTSAYLRSIVVSGAELHYNYSGSCGYFPVLNVSEGFTVDENSKILLPGSVRDNINRILLLGETDTLSPIARITGSAASEIGDLSAVKVAAADEPEKLCPIMLKVMETSEGVKDVVLSLPSNLAVMTNEASQTSSSGAFNEGHEGDWTNGEVPYRDSVLHYWLNVTTYVSGNIDLPNATITAGGTFFCVGGTDFTFKELNFSGCKMGFWGSKDQDRIFKVDRINIYGNNEFYSSNNRRITYKGELCGNGNITFRNDKDGYAAMHFNGESTNYTGRIVIGQRGADTAPNSPTPYKFTFYLDGASTFNGKYSGADAYSSITFSKFPILNVQQNVTLSEPTRGILVKEGVQLTVASTYTTTLTISNQITYAGMVDKRGVGTLDLAGTARFIDGNVDTPPEAGTNVLKVSVGRLRISSKFAADGLDIRFEQGTKLLIPAQTEAGYYNVKWDAPLTINTNNGRLPVVVEGLEADAARKNITVPICTFNAAAAANISEDVFDVSTDTDDLRLKSLQKVSNEDGSVSYIATFGQYGSRIILR